jgi:ADP-dependent NAD(P)H-hydrate dehydratase / NAD(P)H-hydrate epimerase
VSMTEPLYTADEMRAAEGTYPGPTIELMERAGAAASEAVLRRHPDARSVLVWCGGGNNGGDGLVVARHLHSACKDVRVRLLAAESRLTGDPALNLARAKELGIPFVEDGAPVDVVVDALFGTGFSGAPRREAEAAIESINGSRSSIVSVDVPSGVDASTGEARGAAVQAELTVTFHALKVGHVVAPGRFLASNVEVADIGIEHVPTRVRRVRASILDLVPRRTAKSNKFSAGTVLVVGGSPGLSGAPSLAAEAAMRSGAGYVFVAYPTPIGPVVELRLVEAVKRPQPEDGSGHLSPQAVPELVELSARAGAVALGPGLGRTEGVREVVRELLEGIERPIVLDADGLWAVAGHLDWVFARQFPTVLTPHAGELARLLGKDSSRIDERRLDSAQAGADDTGAVVLLKGADTIVAAPGRGPLVVDLGNPGLATAGSGDVLTGVVAAFLAKGMDAQEAAAAAGATHGLAAVLAAREVGYAGMIARDLAPALSRALSEGGAQ